MRDEKLAEEQETVSSSLLGQPAGLGLMVLPPEMAFPFWGHLRLSPSLSGASMVAQW